MAFPGDSAFDTVCPLGDIKTFEDRGTAIQERLRVAKVGLKIVMVDADDRTNGSLDLAAGYQPLAERLSGCSTLSTPRDLMKCKSGFRNGLKSCQQH